MTCTKCGERVYYTGEFHPTISPQRFYACKNKHVFIVYNDTDEPDWGDGSITKWWRYAVNNDDAEYLGRLNR